MHDSVGSPNRRVTSWRVWLLKTTRETTVCKLNKSFALSFLLSVPLSSVVLVCWERFFTLPLLCVVSLVAKFRMLFGLPHSVKISWGPIFAEGQSSTFLWFNFHGRAILKCAAHICSLTPPLADGLERSNQRVQDRSRNGTRISHD